LEKGTLPETFEKGGSMFHPRDDNLIKAEQKKLKDEVMVGTVWS